MARSCRGTVCWPTVATVTGTAGLLPGSCTVGFPEASWEHAERESGAVRSTQRKPAGRKPGQEKRWDDRAMLTRTLIALLAVHGWHRQLPDQLPCSVTASLNTFSRRVTPSMILRSSTADRPASRLATRVRVALRACCRC